MGAPTDRSRPLGRRPGTGTGMVTTTAITGTTTAMTAATGTAVTGTATTIKVRTAASSTATARSTSIQPMPRLTRRAGTIGLALTIWDVWQRIPPRHRKQIVKHARKHGPRLAARLVQSQSRRRRS